MATANVYRFSSKEVHPNSGLYYYGFRFYDPTLQRWLNVAAETTARFRRPSGIKDVKAQCRS